MEIFQSLKTFLEKEVEEPPEEETQELYEKISDMKNRLKRRPEERGEYFSEERIFSMTSIPVSAQGTGMWKGGIVLFLLQGNRA